MASYMKPGKEWVRLWNFYGVLCSNSVNGMNGSQSVSEYTQCQLDHMCISQTTEPIPHDKDRRRSAETIPKATKTKVKTLPALLSCMGIDVLYVCTNKVDQKSEKCLPFGDNKQKTLVTVI
uniref:Transposase n=1 Tax=Panagrellus redivivus TaxID=6233 RepID=A0A7E4VXX7_PANRE